MNAFESAFSLGKFGEAAAALERFKQPLPFLHLLVFLGARQAGDAKLAELELMKAVDDFGKWGKTGRLAVACLKGGNPGGALNIGFSVPEKRIFLAAMGTLFESVREPCFHLAAQLNQSPVFPAIFLKQIVGDAPPVSQGQHQGL